jgi:hypothetical protein
VNEEVARVDAAASFAAVAAVFSEAEHLTELLALAVRLATTTVVPCARAGVVARRDGRLTSIAASDPEAHRLNGLNLTLEQGPAVDVLDTGQSVYVPDLSDDRRWPALARGAWGAGPVLATSIEDGTDEPKALVFYGAPGMAFDRIDRAHGVVFATHVSLALSALQRHLREHELAEQLRRGLDSRTVIGQAQGIVMARAGLNEREAFEVLRRASQHRNIKLREIAAYVVETGDIPTVD